MRVHTPGSLGEALERLAAPEGPTPVPIAGGTDLLVHWPQRIEEHEKDYLDLWGLDELRGHRWTEEALVLGGTTTYWDLVTDARAREEFPMLVDAARQVGAVQIQSRGTWAGNIVNASPAADGVPVLMAHDATVELTSAEGRDVIPLSEFYLGYKEMRRTPDQLVTAVRVPRRAHDVQRFVKVGSRRAQAIAKVGVAIAHSEAGWRIVVASVAPTVRRCPSVEVLLEEGAPISGPEDLLPALGEHVSPIDDLRSTARYREIVLAQVLYHDLEEFWSSPS